MNDQWCVAFSAEHNDSDTGECMLLADGPGVYVGNGPRDQGWHCHVNMDRESDHTESFGEYPDDYMDAPSQDNAQQLLDMIDYMDMLV